MNNRSQKYAKYLGEIFKELLIPECIIVETNIKVGPKERIPVLEFGKDGVSYKESIDLGLSNIPIVIRSLEKEDWTERQKERLPDGIRDIYKKDYLLDFHCEKTIETWDIKQNLANWFFFSKQMSLETKNALSYAITTFPLNKEFIKQFQYVQVSKGVYRTNDIFANCVQLAVLPELPNNPWNAPIKFFSDDPKEREQAIQDLNELGINVEKYIL